MHLLGFLVSICTVRKKCIQVARLLHQMTQRLQHRQTNGDSCWQTISRTPCCVDMQNHTTLQVPGINPHPHSQPKWNTYCQETPRVSGWLLLLVSCFQLETDLTTLSSSQAPLAVQHSLMLQISSWPTLKGPWELESLLMATWGTFISTQHECVLVRAKIFFLTKKWEAKTKAPSIQSSLGRACLSRHNLGSPKSVSGSFIKIN